jgi:hypothetical protein
MKKRKINVKLIKGNLLKETLTFASDIKANLIIFGREHKQKGLFGFPFKNFKRKLVEKNKYSILFLN